MNLSEPTAIVPTRNEEKNIARFLASVPEAVELIVVDAYGGREGSGLTGLLTRGGQRRERF